MRLESHLNQNIEVLFIWLRASKEIRMARKQERGRDEADSLKHFEFIDNLIPDIDSFELKNGKYISIDTTSKTIQEIIYEVKSKI